MRPTQEPAAASIWATPPPLPRFPVQFFEGPVGGRLQHFASNWALIGDDPWVLSVLSSGYYLPLEGVVPLTSSPPPGLGYSPGHPLFDETLRQLENLLSKGAVEPVADDSPGFYSRLFLVPKKTTEWRPVIDLSALNKYMDPPRFRMESLGSILSGTRPDQWATSIDLRDAFFHIPVAPRHRKYLRFSVAGRSFQFKALPFGLGTSPYVFTRVMAVVGGFVRAQGLFLFLYLDDWLLLSASSSAADMWIEWLLALVKALGLIPNIPKCDLTPAQTYPFIGVWFDLIRATARPADHRIAALQELICAFRACPALPAVYWVRLLGHLSSLEKLVPRGRLQSRPLQFCLRRQWNQRQDSDSVLIVMSDLASEAFDWWSNPANLVRGVSLTPPAPDLRLFTDASTDGWGAHLDLLRAQGVWSQKNQKLHINNLELLTVLLSLKVFREEVRDRHVLVMTDNTTVVGQIKNQGGTHSWSLYLITRSLFQWADRNRVTISAQHIPGRLNVLADRLSRRNQILPAEWSLAPAVVDRFWKVWGRPHLDLFATRDNAKLPLFVSPYQDPAAWDTDALSLSWTGLWVYAFPPFALLMEVLQKLLSEPCEMILVAPAWPTQAWFPLLLQLSSEQPRQIPLSARLLRQPDNGVFHLDPAMLHLHAWRLSGLRGGTPLPSLRRWLQTPVSSIAEARSLEAGIQPVLLPP